MKKLLIIASILIPLFAYAQDTNGISITSSFKVPESEFNISNTISSPSQRATIVMMNPDYQVTPGDVYELSFVSTSGVQSLSLFVGYDYTIKLSTMGTLKCEGKTYLQVKDEILSLVKRTYPLSAPELIVTDAGSFPIYLNGEVKESCKVITWGDIRLSQLLTDYATGYASLRNIRITSRNGNSAEYDVFESKRNGDLSSDPYLRPGDIISFFRVEKEIRLSGAVYRPGNYQLLAGETLLDVVERYGDGFVDNADKKRIKIIRAVEGKEAVGERFEVPFEEAASFEMKNLDQVSIPVIQTFLPVVFFEGAIYQNIEETEINLTASQKVPYSFYPGETLADAVRAMRNQFVQMSDIEKAYVKRGGEMIPADLSRYLYDHDFTKDIVLQPNDTIVVPFRQFFVTVSGAVAIPGRYPYVPDRSWRYYVNLAGGIDPLRNSLDAFKVYNLDDEVLKDVDDIPPEAKIEVATNSFLFYFNQYAPVITTVLSIISTSLSLYFATGGTL